MKTPVLRPKAYLKARHKNVREALKRLQLDALLLTHPPDLAYLTNFTGHDSVGLLTAGGDLHIVTDFRYKEQIALEAGWTLAHVREGKMSDELARVMLDAGVKRVGFEANFTTFGQVDALDSAIKDNGKTRNGKKDHGKPADEKTGPKRPPGGLAGLTPSPSRPSPLGNGGQVTPEPPPDAVEPNTGAVELVPLEDVMANQRKVKDDHEIALIRKSIAIAEEAFDAVRGEIVVGQSEAYLAGLLILELRSRGAEGTSFEPIVAAAANSSLPHYRPIGDVLVQKDQPLLFDWGALVGGYCSDLTRTFMIGTVSERMKQIHRVVLQAQQEAIAFLRPGVTTRQADQVARDVIEKAGFGDYFGHGLGHGIGRDIHELPSMRRSGGEEELRPGMVVTVEPGIYLPGEGGVRIEDDVLITHSGREVLTSLPKDFEACHIE